MPGLMSAAPHDGRWPVDMLDEVNRWDGPTPIGLATRRQRRREHWTPVSRLLRRRDRPKGRRKARPGRWKAARPGRVRPGSVRPCRTHGKR